MRREAALATNAGLGAERCPFCPLFCERHLVLRGLASSASRGVLLCRSTIFAWNGRSVHFNITDKCKCMGCLLPQSCCPYKFTRAESFSRSAQHAQKWGAGIDEAINVSLKYVTTM